MVKLLSINIDGPDERTVRRYQRIEIIGSNEDLQSREFRMRKKVVALFLRFERVGV